MKNSIILMLVGIAVIVGGLFSCGYWLKVWLILVPIGGLAIFILGTMKLIKNLSNENE
jgi:hypothetical protein